MTGSRHYGDPCGVARALDLVGDRWALLVVRELLFGAKRFLQLRAGLEPVSPNVLALRLRDLEQAGVVRRALLGPPAGVAVYELTERGHALEPVLIALAGWGAAEPVTAARELSPSALLLALKTTFNPAAAVGADAVIGLGIDSDWYEVRVAGGTINISRGIADRPDVTLEADVATLRAVAFGRLPVKAAVGDGVLAVTGDRAVAGRFARMFRVPTPHRADTAGSAGGT